MVSLSPQDSIHDWVGQEVTIQFLAASVVDGISDLESIRGKLAAADDVGLILISHAEWREYDNEQGSRWVSGEEKGFIPWSAVARISVRNR